MRTILFTILSCSLFLNTASAQQTPLETLKVIRAEYPTPMSPAQLGQMLNRVAWIHRSEGLMLLGKPGGTNCPSPQGVLVSCDFLVYGTLQGYDVLADQDNLATPVWQGPQDLSGAIQNGSRTLVPSVAPIAAIAPTPPPASPTSPVPPTQQPTQPTMQQLSDQISDMRTSLEEHREEARKTRSAVMNFLGNWRNYVKLAAGVLGMLGVQQVSK